MGCQPPRSYRVRCVFLNCGQCFGIVLLSGRGHRSSCDSDVRQLDSCGFRQLAGWDSVPLPLLVDRLPSEVVRVSRPPPRYGVSTRAVLCSGRSPQPSGSVLGAAWSLHPQVATALLRAWGSLSLDLFTTRLPAVLPLSCLVPNPRVVFLDAFHIPRDYLGVYAFLPFLSSDGWWLELERPQSLLDSGRPPLWLVKEWFATLPLPFLVVFLVHLCRGKGFVGLVSLCPAGLSSGGLSYIFLCYLAISRGCRP